MSPKLVLAALLLLADRTWACTCHVTALSAGAKLFVQKEGRGPWIAAAPTMRLHDADQLRLDGGDATLVCELTKAPLRKGLQSLPCAGSSSRMTIKGQIVDGDLSTPDAAAPRLLAPRAGAVRTRTPLVRWRALPGIKVYDVTVRGEDVEWHKTVQASGTEREVSLPYPSDVPKLSSGIYYKAIVSANGKQSDRSDPQGLGFTVIGDEELRQLQADESAVGALQLDATNSAILLASRYGNARLFSEAAAVLESKDVERTGEVARLLAEIYSATAAFDEARLILANAAESANDTARGRAETFERLAELESRTGRSAAAWMTRAADAYAAIGDTQKADVLRSSLNEKKQ